MSSDEEPLCPIPEELFVNHKPWSNEELAAIVRNATKNVNCQLDTIHANCQQHRRQYWTDCRNYYCKSHGSSHQVRGSYIGLEDTICLVCGHRGYGYLSCSWIAPVLQKGKKFQANQQNSCKEAAPSTTPHPVVETMEERQIRNARIARNTPWNTVVSAPPAPQAEPSNYITIAVTTRSQNQPKK